MEVTKKKPETALKKVIRKVEPPKAKKSTEVPKFILASELIKKGLKKAARTDSDPEAIKKMVSKKPVEEEEGESTASPPADTIMGTIEEFNALINDFAIDFLEFEDMVQQYSNHTQDLFDRLTFLLKAEKGSSKDADLEEEKELSSQEY